MKNGIIALDPRVKLVLFFLTCIFERTKIRERLERTVKELKLEDLLDRNIFELSGGEKQQIACGCVYAAEPQIYILDEPSSNMDVNAICRLKTILRKLKEKKKTVILSEHRLYYLMELADRFVFMENGRIRGSYTANQLKSLPYSQMEKMGLRATSLSRVTYTAEKLPDTLRTGENAVELKYISCRKGGRVVLKLDRLKIPAQAVIAVIGENGAGKSTLAEVLCGIRSGGGTVRIEGRYTDTKERNEMCYMVMQDVNHQLFCESVEKEVLLGTAKERKKRADSLLKKMALSEFKDRHPSTLSGGEKQRVAICAAEAAQKRVVVYDEPTSGLDHDGMKRLCRLIRGSAPEYGATVVITHDMELIMGCCSHVLHLENGRAVEYYPLNDFGIERTKEYFMDEGGCKMARKKEERKTGMARLMELSGRKKGFMIPSIIFACLASVMSFVPHLSIYYIILEILKNYPDIGGTDGRKIILLGLAALGGVIINILFYFLALALSHLAAFGTLYELKVEFTRHLARLPLGFHLNYGSGRLRKITDENIEKVEGFIAHQLPDLVSAMVAPLVMILILLCVDIRYGLVALLGIAVAYIIEIVGYGRGGKEKMDQYQNALEEMNNAAVEYVRGITVVKAFRQTVYSFNRLYESIKRYTAFVIPHTLSWRGLMSLYTTMVNNIYLLLIPVAIWIGTNASGDNYVDFASATIFYLLFVPSISSVMMKVMYASSNCMQIHSSVERMDEVLDTPILEEAGTPVKCEAGDITFEQVSFAYDDKNIKALKEVSFKAKKGCVTAVVRPSGGGKSTIASLLPRFYDVTAGSIKIGGIDIRDISTEDLMNTVGFVFQDVYLFKQSIRDNIRMGNPDATDEEVIAAAKAAQCHEFIMALPKGYDTVYGRDGVYLSGGEQQRVSIARAIVKNAPILVLDEATAFADPENEHLIQMALKALIADKTVIMIAHRLSTIRYADQIIVMDEGRLVESGTHEELLRLNGKYSRMWNTYTKTISWKM